MKNTDLCESQVSISGTYSVICVARKPPDKKFNDTAHYIGRDKSDAIILDDITIKLSVGYSEEHKIYGYGTAYNNGKDQSDAGILPYKYSSVACVRPRSNVADIFSLEIVIQ